MVLVLVLGGLFAWKGDALLGKMSPNKQTYQQCIKYETWWKNGVWTPEVSKIFRDKGSANTAWTNCKETYDDITAYYTKEDCLQIKNWYDHGVWTPEMKKLGLDADVDVYNACSAYGIVL